MKLKKHLSFVLFLFFSSISSGAVWSAQIKESEPGGAVTHSVVTHDELKKILAENNRINAERNAEINYKRDLKTDKKITNLQKRVDELNETVNVKNELIEQLVQDKKEKDKEIKNLRKILNKRGIPDNEIDKQLQEMDPQRANQIIEGHREEAKNLLQNRKPPSQKDCSTLKKAGAVVGVLLIVAIIGYLGGGFGGSGSSK